MDARAHWNGPGRSADRPASPLAARPLGFSRFHAELRRLADKDGRQGARYLRHQLVRFYDTYRFILRHYGAPRRLASFGAGSAYVEAVLAAHHGTQVVVFDFPVARELHRAVYDRYGFRFVPVDLTAPMRPAEAREAYDLVLCAEIVEHLPVAPSIQFADNFARLGAQAPLVVTTPNASSLRHVLKLLFMQPVLPPAERTFGEVCFENEGVHRREYVPREICDALAKVGHRLHASAFTWYHRPEGAAEGAIYPLELLVGRFRPCMILGSRPN